MQRRLAAINESIERYPTSMDTADRRAEVRGNNGIHQRRYWTALSSSAAPPSGSKAAC